MFLSGFLGDEEEERDYNKQVADSKKAKSDYALAFRGTPIDVSKARANGLSITSKIGTALSLVSIVSAFSDINKLIKEDCKADQKINDIGTFEGIGSIIGGNALSSGAAAIGSAATAALTAKAFSALGTTISPIAGTIIGGLIGYGL